MIMCESSMDQLNERLGSPMSIIPFRPNVMVEGSAPYDEVGSLLYTILTIQL